MREEIIEAVAVTLLWVTLGYFVSFEGVVIGALALIYIKVVSR